MKGDLANIKIIFSGKFEGLTDLEWKISEDIFPDIKSTFSWNATHSFSLCSQYLTLHLQLPEVVWCDVPTGDIWAS